ncbi:hypothetical protein HDU67_008972 [Dinochytrium kinnereticum]|nr:hypothetical protein HDU67_008972 [Dinochytrium kinnereticum]
MVRWTAPSFCNARWLTAVTLLLGRILAVCRAGYDPAAQYAAYAAAYPSNGASAGEAAPGTVPATVMPSAPAAPPAAANGAPDTTSPEYAAWYTQWHNWMASAGQTSMAGYPQNYQWGYYQQQMQQAQQLQPTPQIHQSPIASSQSISTSMQASKFVHAKPQSFQTPTKPPTSQLSKAEHMKSTASQFLASSKNKPAYISVKSTVAAPVFSEPAEEKKEEKAKSGAWPDPLKNYVTKVFASCSMSNRDAVERQLKELIGTVSAKDALYSTDWDKMPLPSLCEQKPPTTASPKTPTVKTLSISEKSQLQVKRKRIGSPVVEDRWANNRNTAGVDVDEDDSLSHLPPHLRREEIERREARSRRFKEAEEEEKAKMKLRKKEGKRAKMMALAAGADGNPDVIDWDEHTIVGVCMKLEKSYLRLTSAPDPSTVRPLQILRKTLELLGKKWKEEQNYTYICDQFKSLRQDLTVQRIKNEFTVRVYEAHARIALEKGDVGEYNQCQAQLKELFRLGLPGCIDEFLGYRILYLVYTKNRTDQVKILSELSSDAKKGLGVKHALSVRKAVVGGDYHSLFLLYNRAPHMSMYLMDFFIELERFKAMKTISKAYRPTLSVDFLAKELGYIHPDDDEDGRVQAVGVCRKWLRELGAPFLKGSKEEMVDAKLSAAFFGAKVMEVTSKGVDIKGQIY